MTLDQFTASTRLETTAASIVSLVRDMSAEQARWKPDPKSWSALEVINHLYDEEREDFRQRVDLTLHSTGVVPPPIDPEGWVTERSYNTRDLQESVERFQREREQSLAWLRSLQDPDWTLPSAHPRLQGMHAGDFLASWVAHDLLHLRQLIELRYAYLGTETERYSVRYAGEW
jgi:hypothetical protein